MRFLLCGRGSRANSGYPNIGDFWAVIITSCRPEPACNTRESTGGARWTIVCRDTAARPVHPAGFGEDRNSCGADKVSVLMSAYRTGEGNQARAAERRCRTHRLELCSLAHMLVAKQPDRADYSSGTKRWVPGKRTELLTALALAQQVMWDEPQHAGAAVSTLFYWLRPCAVSA